MQIHTIYQLNHLQDIVDGAHMIIKYFSEAAFSIMTFWFVITEGQH